MRKPCCGVSAWIDEAVLEDAVEVGFVIVVEGHIAVFYEIEIYHIAVLPVAPYLSPAVIAGRVCVGDVDGEPQGVFAGVGHTDAVVADGHLVESVEITEISEDRVFTALLPLVESDIADSVLGGVEDEYAVWEFAFYDFQLDASFVSAAERRPPAAELSRVVLVPIPFKVVARLRRQD